MTSADPAACLVVFVKNGAAGQVKTRLSPPLTARQACRLYRAFVKDVLEKVSRLSVRGRVVAYAGDRAGLEESVPSCFDLVPQGPGNLGSRISRVFEWGFEEGFSKMVVMGSDSPTLPMDFIGKAFRLLSEKDFVLGPAWDGGYYLIGARPPAREPWPERLFEGVRWSTSRTLVQTLARLKSVGKTFGVLPLWYDVDRGEDLEFLKLDVMCGPSFKKTSQVLRSLGWL